MWFPRHQLALQLYCSPEGQVRMNADTDRRQSDATICCVEHFRVIAKISCWVTAGSHQHRCRLRVLFPARRLLGPDSRDMIYEKISVCRLKPLLLPVRHSSLPYSCTGASFEQVPTWVLVQTSIGIVSGYSGGLSSLAPARRIARNRLGAAG